MTERIIRPAGSLGGRMTPASFPFYTTGEDNLRVTSYNSLEGVTLAIVGRTLGSDGVPSPLTAFQTPASDRTAVASDIGLSGTTLLNLTVFASAGAPVIGQTFVIVQLIRGFGSAALVLGTLLQGYVTAKQAIGFPGSPIQSSIDGGGYYYEPVFNVGGPQVTLQWVVPTGARWRIHGGGVTLTTSAAAGNRQLFISHRTPANHNVAQNFAPAVVPASTSAPHVFAPGIQGSEKAIAGGFQVMALMDPLIITAGGIFRADILNALAGDDLTIGQYQIFVEEWLTVN